MIVTLISAGLIAVGVLIYVILDGFDLGVGILFPFAPNEQDRNCMINSIAPVWDGNETWLILGGVVLLGCFPKAYALSLSALYVPIMLLLFALIFRGVSFEFRMKATPKGIALWNQTFFWGSTLAAFAQGVLLGSLVEGVTIVDGQFAGGLFDWLKPLPLLTGLAVTAGYALLGATWLIMKTEGAMQDWSRKMAVKLSVAVIGFMGVVSLMTAFARPDITARWFDSLNFLFLSPVPLITGMLCYFLWRCVRRGDEYMPFFLSVGLFVMGYIGLAISLWPNIIPPSLTIWDAASPVDSQIFVLICVALTLPMVLVYTWYAYKVFHGKASSEGGYAGGR